MEKEKKPKKLEKYNYFAKSVLGEGTFGKVYKGWHSETKVEVAIKKIDKHMLESDSYLQRGLFNEISIMKSLSNPNIVQMLDILETSNNFYIIQEYCSGGNLHDI